MARPNPKKFKFGPWLPDLPDLDNPGILEALNVLPITSNDGGYAPYNPLSTSGSAFTTSTVIDATALRTHASSGQSYLYVGTVDGNLYQVSSGGGTWTDYAGGALGWILSLAQYNTFVFATDDAHGIYYKTIGSASNFVQASGAPSCNVLGVIGQFLLAGNITASPNSYPNLLAWSVIDDPTNWPTPGSAAAVAGESGEQYLHLELGPITGIYGGDQWGVILQSAGITRVTYVGGTDVFQFDTLASGIGMEFSHCGIKVGRKVYFASTKGFWATDGMTLEPIGDSKVNLWFINNVVNVSGLGSGSCAVDWRNKLILWSFPDGTHATPCIIYNFEQQRFTHASDSNVALMIPGDDSAFSSYGLQGIGLDKKLGGFIGSPGTATLTSAEVELNPGSKALVQGFRPQVAGSNSVTCRIGSRMQQSNSVSYSAALTPNANSGFADCLIEAGYHRAEIDITGYFAQAIGGEFIATPSGAF